MSYAYGKRIASVVHLAAAIAMAEVTRAGRFANVLLGLWIVLAPFLLAGAGAEARWNGVFVGAAPVALAIRRGKIQERYGAWGRYVAEVCGC